MLFALFDGDAFLSSAAAQSPSTGNGAQRFADLQELNNKLGRAITRLEGELTKKLSVVKDVGRERRTLNDLEATKLRAVAQFPAVFALPYAETFTALSCIDERIAVGKALLDGLQGGFFSDFPRAAGERYASLRLLSSLKLAKECKDTLEAELRGNASVPRGILQDLTELNNKLSRAITRLEGELTKKLSVVKDIGRERRTLNDLEATKLRAVGQFPEVIDPPYAEIFASLSCIDERIAVGKALVDGLQGGFFSDFPRAAGKRYASLRLLSSLKLAKECKDTLEIELLHSFDLKPSEQMEVGVNQTTPNGTDTTKPSRLNAPKPLQHAYATNGFIGRHEHDYVASGVDGGHPDSWPTGKNVLFFDVFDLFNTTKSAQKVEKASEKSLKSKGFVPIHDTSLGSGEKVFQLQPAGSPLLSTIIYVQRGTFILKIAGSCKGCSRGSVESSLKSLAQFQLDQAVRMGFPGPFAPTSGGGGGGSPTASGSLTNGSGSILNYSIQTNTSANAFELILPSGDDTSKVSPPSGFNCTDSGHVEFCTGSVQPNTPLSGSFDHTATIAANCGCVQIAFSRDGGMTWSPNPPATLSGPPSSSPPPAASCSGHAILGNIFGGQAHQVTADFTCPKPSTEFSLTVPSGYQITGGQATNSASSGYTCSLNSTMSTVDCIGNAPAGSTTYVQFTTSPNPQAGMNLALKVFFGDGSTTSFTLTT